VNEQVRFLFPGVLVFLFPLLSLSLFISSLLFPLCFFCLSGLPKGVFNLVTGDATAIGKELTSNFAVRKITFTGSTRVCTAKQTDTQTLFLSLLSLMREGEQNFLFLSALLIASLCAGG
jgi:hypothetical protein